MTEDEPLLFPRTSAAPPDSNGNDAPSSLPKRVNSDALLGRSRELIIAHNGREYRLRQTQNGKLILTA